MRLILSVDSLSPRLTGIGRYTWELVTRLQQLQCLKQLRLYRGGRWVKDPSSLLIGHPPLKVHRNARDLTSQLIRTVSRFPQSAKNFYWRTTCLANVFHAPNYFLPPFARNGVITVHDLSVLKFPESHPVARVKQWELEFKRSLDRATHLITDSEVTRQEVITELEWPADRVTTVALGVSPEFRPRRAIEIADKLAALGLQPGQYVLCVATIEPRKKIDSLLAAYGALPASLRERYPLVLVGGEGWRADRLLVQMAEAAAQGWLNHLGYVEAHALPMLYAGAAGFVYPSMYEGFGLPVLEAMASGVPVVTSNRSSLPEVAGGAAWLVDPDQPKELTSAIEEMLVELPSREKAVSLGLSNACQYTWDRCMHNTMDVYRKIQMA